MVGITAITHNRNAPQNLPSTNFQTEMGLINNNSSVPILRSSEKLFMVMAGTKKIKTQGANKKSCSNRQIRNQKCCIRP